jgi:hypothetical protein
VGGSVLGSAVCSTGGGAPPLVNVSESVGAVSAAAGEV